MNLPDDIVLKIVTHNKILFSQTSKKYYNLFDNFNIIINNNIPFYEKYIYKRLYKCKYIQITGTSNNLQSNWLIMKNLSLLIQNGWSGLTSLSIILQPDRDSNESIWYDYKLLSVINSSNLIELNLSGFRNIGLSDINKIFHQNNKIQKLKLDSKSDIYIQTNSDSSYNEYYDKMLAPYTWLPFHSYLQINNLKFLDISNRLLALSCNINEVILNLQYLTNLIHLDMSNNYIQNNNLKSMNTLLSYCTNLISLDIRSNMINDIENLHDNLSQLKSLGLSQSRCIHSNININNLDNIKILFIGEAKNIINVFNLYFIEKLELDIDIVFLIRFQHFMHSNMFLKLKHIQLNIDMWILNLDVFSLFETFLNFLNNLPSLNTIVFCCNIYEATENYIKLLFNNKKTLFFKNNPNFELMNFYESLEYIQEDANN